MTDLPPSGQRRETEIAAGGWGIVLQARAWLARRQPGPPPLPSRDRGGGGGGGAQQRAPIAPTVGGAGLTPRTVGFIQSAAEVKLGVRQGGRRGVEAQVPTDSATPPPPCPESSPQACAPAITRRAAAHNPRDRSRD
jgi:hypothetical protein